MLYRVLFGAAVAAGLFWLIDRDGERDVVAGVHRLGDDGAGFDLIARILELDAARTGADSRCLVTHGLALVLASRRVHARIATALHYARLSQASGLMPQITG